MRKRDLRDWIALWRKLALFAFAFLLAVSWIAIDRFVDPVAAAHAVRVEIPQYCGLAAAGVGFPEWMQVETEYRYDANTPAGIVLSQTPVAGSFRKLTDEDPLCRLSLVVSMGEERCLLPDVVGQEIRQAILSLRACGAAVETERIPGETEGEVLEMSPRGGTEVPVGSTVRLTVGGGEATGTVSVPELAGHTRTEALVSLWLSGLSVREVVEEVSGAPAGTVLRQSHPAGTLVMPGTQITLYVSGEEPEP